MTSVLVSAWGRSWREVRVSGRLAAPPGTVWALLADHEGMPRWMPVREVVRRSAGTPDPDGRGAVRTIKSGGWVFDEEIVDWKPGERMEYRVIAGAPLREHRGVIDLAAEEGGTRLTWTVGFRPLLPGTGFLLARTVRSLLEGALEGLARALG